MISLSNSEAMITSVLLFFAYVLSITLSGNFQAYIAKWMGDDTAYDAGFAEFNPFNFIGALSLIWFVLLQLMIGRPIPIKLRNLYPSWWPLRVFLTFGARTIFNIAIATLSSVTALLLCGPILANSASLLGVSSSLGSTQISSMQLILCRFFGAMTLANIILATFSSIRQTIFFFVMYKMEKNYSFIEHADYLLAFGPLLVVFFFGSTIINTFLYIVGCLVLGITKVCGVA